jgi:hypothetical protein
MVLGLTAILYSAPQQQQTFATPQDAIQATIQASERNDTAALRQIFGPESKDIVQSGDTQQDKADRAEFVNLARQRAEVSQDPSNADRATFTIGNEDWPFPVPLVRVDGKWKFDTASGKMEIMAHRIGENEVDAIEASRAFLAAELDYAKTAHDGAGILEYAQKVPSPKALAEAVESGKPYRGYHFRILTAQGPSAPGGAVNYIVNGRMIGGFALLAWPAEYEVSGVKTFMVSHDGVVYEKDLGAKTSGVASQIKRFDPDPSWREVRAD